MKASALRPTLVSLLVAGAAAACADRDVVTPAAPVAPPAASITAQYRCDADVHAGIITCAVPAPSGGARPDLIVGGQNVFVKLRSSNITVSSGIFAFDVSLQNLLAQPMGTTDGTTPDPAGTRIFFVSGPTVTAGSGSVSVANPDGTATFTAAGQKYYEYDGVIGPGATSGNKNWQIAFDPGVTHFSFLLLVSAPIPKESGWVSISEPNQTINVGEQVALTGKVLSGTGVQISAPVTWSTSDSTVATIDGGGNVTGVANGTAVITATAGARSGTTTVTVAPVDSAAPALTGFSVSPTTVNAGDSVGFNVTATDAGVGIASVAVSAVSPSFSQTASCSTQTPSSGTINSGTFTCYAHIPVGAQAGAWNALSVTLADRRENTSSNTVFVGPYPHTFTVVDAAPDTSKPALTGLSIAPASVNAGDSATLAVGVSDTGTGVSQVEASFQSPAGGQQATCISSTPASGTANAGTFDCHARFPAGSVPGSWTLSFLGIVDRAGNTTFLSASQIASGGYPDSVTVIDAAPDTTAPTLAGVSFAATAHTTDSVTVTVTAADAGSGVRFVDVSFRAPTLITETATCAGVTPASGTSAYGTYTCKLGFPAGAETGTWTLTDLILSDATGNLRSMDTGDLKALGYATTLTVSP